MLSIIHRLRRDPFVRNSALFFTGSMIVAFISYCFHPILSRMLSIGDFGEVQALLALFLELTMALSAFTLATIHASTNCERSEECAAVVNVLNKGALILVGILFAAVAIGAHYFASAFRFNSVYPFFVLAALLITTVFYSIRVGYLQGQQKFGKVTVANIIVAGGRLAFSVLFVWLGWRSTGAIGGLVVAQALALGFVYWYTRHALDAKRNEAMILPRTRVLDELRYVVLTFIAMAFVTILYTADVLAVKHYFSPDIAGFYSGMSAVAKIIVFVCAPLATVMLTSIKRAQSPSLNRRVLLKGLVSAFLVGGSALLAFIVMPQFIVRILMGSRYAVFAHYLPFLAISFFLVSFINVFVMFGLALRQKSLILLAIFGSFVLFFLILIHHATVGQVIENFIIASALSLVGSIVLTWKSMWEKDAPPELVSQPV